ncbi:hypothetical protein ACFC0K_36365 [Streptomyces hydrogenans]|uniref:hypothetical protein n=1 Tax=Streptomyces hydrogenans TaxID=1873719 RepID=UPI0035DBFDEB
MHTALRTSFFTEPYCPKGLFIRFVTTGGSFVDVTGSGEHSDQNRWACHGCGELSDRPEKDFLFRIRPDANAMRHPAAPATVVAVPDPDHGASTTWAR